MATKKRTICAVSALAIAVLCCLCYTLIPRSWQQVIGVDTVDALSGSYHDMTGIHGYGSWDLDETEGESPAAQAIVSALEGRSYRADLANLRSYTPFPRRSFHVTGATALELFLFTQKKLAIVTVYSDGQLTLHSASTGFLSYQTDEGLFQEVLQVLQQYSGLE